MSKKKKHTDEIRKHLEINKKKKNTTYQTFGMLQKQYYEGNLEL